LTRSAEGAATDYGQRTATHRGAAAIGVAAIIEEPHAIAALGDRQVVTPELANSSPTVFIVLVSALEPPSLKVAVPLFCNWI